MILCKDTTSPFHSSSLNLLLIRRLPPKWRFLRNLADCIPANLEVTIDERVEAS